MSTAQCCVPPALSRRGTAHKVFGSPEEKRKNVSPCYADGLENLHIPVHISLSPSPSVHIYIFIYLFMYYVFIYLLNSGYDVTLKYTNDITSEYTIQTPYKDTCVCVF